MPPWVQFVDQHPMQPYPMQQTPDQLFLTDDNLSYWARGPYAHQAMNRDPIDASNAHILAQALAARMVAICLNKPIASSATELVDSPRSSIWLIPALLLAWQRDAFQAAADAEKLPLALNLRSGVPAPCPALGLCRLCARPCNSL